jgi:hypothetical protein
MSNRPSNTTRPATVRVHIERIVIDAGLIGGTQTRALQRALAEELSRLLAMDPAHLYPSFTRQALQAAQPVVMQPASGAEGLGTSVAQSMYQALAAATSAPTKQGGQGGPARPTAASATPLNRGGSP